MLLMDWYKQWTAKCERHSDEELIRLRDTSKDCIELSTRDGYAEYATQFHREYLVAKQVAEKRGLYES